MKQFFGVLVIGGINYHGKHLPEQEPSDAHDRGELYE